MTKKLSAIILKILFILFSIEAGLHLTEYFYYFISKKTSPQNIENNYNTFRIICLGESTVAGDGSSDFKYFETDSKFAFPNQLEILLQKEYPEKDIQVINLGVVAITAKQILKNLNYHLKTYDPDMVIYLAGANVTYGGPLWPIFHAFDKDSILYKISTHMNDLKIFKLLVALKLRIFYKDKNSDLPIQNTLKLGGRIYSIYDTKLLKQTWPAVREVHFAVSDTLDILSAKDIKVLVSGYLNCEISDYLKELAEKHSFPYCDQETSYKNFKSQNKTDEILSSDGWHPNDKGYFIMAENLFKTIIENKMLKNSR